MTEHPANPSHPLRVLLFSPKGAGLHYGGPGTSALRLYTKAAPGRFNITLAHGYREQATQTCFQQHHFLGIEPVHARVLDQWRFIQRSRKWIRENARQFDVFHGLAAYHTTVSPALAAQRAGLPAVVKPAVFRGDLHDKGGWKRLLAMPRRRRRMLRELAGVIAISRDIADELRSYGFDESRIARIPNGVDIDQFRPPADLNEKARLREALGLDPHLPLLLFVGAVVERKRPHLLIDALAILKKRGITSQLVIVGPANEHDYPAQLHARAKDANVPLRWFDFTPDVAPYYRAADIFSLPSLREGMPNALLEAMATALPSVNTYASGITDLIDDGRTGRLVQPEPGALAEAIAHYQQNPEQAHAHGQAARACVEKHYSAHAVLDAHERLFRRIMAGGNAAE